MHNYAYGAAAALQKLGLAQDYSDVHAKLRELAEPSLFNRVEGLFTRKFPHEADTTPPAQIGAEQALLKQKLRLTPQQHGSVPLGLSIPGESDIDFFLRPTSVKRFEDLRHKLPSLGYKPSSLNTPDSAFQVYKRRSRGGEDLPVDVAVMFGPGADRYTSGQESAHAIAKTIPQDLRAALIKKKHLLKYSPFSNFERFSKWKRQLNRALSAQQLAREEYGSLPKTAAVIDLSDPHQLDKFTRFVNNENLYGHRTHNLQSVLNQGGLSAALDSLHRGNLKSYEAGHTQGTHEAMPYTDLSPEDLGSLEQNILVDTPNTGVYDTMAQRLGMTADQVKGNFIRQRYNKIRQFLRSQQDPEAFRRANLAVPKLGPNIFLTRGGVLDTPAYGNASLLFHTNRATPSPYMNLVTDEYIVPPKDVMTPQSVPVRHGYAILPQADIAGFEKTHPKMKYVAQESLPEDLRKQLFKPTHDIKETWERWAPAAFAGKLEMLETR